MMNIPELKICPFCGGKVKSKVGFGGITYFICQNAKFTAITSFKEQTGNPAELFNRRVTEPTVMPQAITKAVCNKIQAQHESLLSQIQRDVLQQAMTKRRGL